MSQVIDIEKIGSRHVCQYCLLEFTQKSSVDRHIANGSCKVKNPVQSKKELIRRDNVREKDMEILLETVKHGMAGMKDAFETLNTRISSLPQVVSQPHAMTNNNYQNLNILCLGKDDNLFDMLSSSEGIVNALTYMKNCALARLAGDCRILEKAYKLDTPEAAIMFVNKSKTKYVYYDERRRRIVEANAAVMAKKIAGILQRSYLKGMDGFKTDLLGNDRDDPDWAELPELEAYDMQTWNEHIHQLADEKYQKQVLRSLKIPTEEPRED